MDPSTHNAELPDPDPPTLDPGHGVSSAPTPLGPGSETPAQTPPPITRTFSPGAPTVPEDRLPAAPIPFKGAMIDGYEILDMIGRGGMGIVFKARQPNSGQTVALKMIRDVAFADQESRDRFVQEIQALGRVQPAKNIIPIFHVGTHKNESFYVMPFLAGGSLSSQLKRFQNERRKAVALVEKLARAVHRLHQHNIIHRDIKPSNVFLDGEDEPYLGDFGLAKLLDADHTLTGAFQRLGTPHYMAPEQTGLMFGAVSPRCDVWSLGVLLYELTAGSRPFTAPKGEESSTLLFKIVYDDPPRPRSHKTDIDLGLEAVILKCLEKRPQDRFASAEELADELARWLRQEKVRTPQLTPVGRFTRRHPWVSTYLALATLLVLAGVTTAVVVADRRRRDSPEYILQTIRDEFKKNESVELVPDKGAARWHASLHKPVNNYVGQDGYWVLETFGVGLVALLRDIPFDTYKLRAEIRHRTGDPHHGQVGIFVGHQQIERQGQPVHLVCNLVFSEILNRTPSGPMPPKAKPVLVRPDNPAQLKYRLFADLGLPSEINEPINLPKEVMFKPVDLNWNTWHTLEVEVRRDDIVFQFDGEGRPPAPRAKAEKDLQDRIKDRQGRHPATWGPLGDMSDLALSPRGALGIVVANSSIAVKNITLTHLR